MTDETQALLPVTQDATIDFLNHAFRNIELPELFPGDLADIAGGLERFACSQSHSLPGDEAARIKAVMSILWKREQYNGVGPDYDNYRPGSKFDMGGRVERYEKEARDIIAALAALTPSALSGNAGAAGPWLKVGTFEPEPDALYLVQGTLRTSVKRGSKIDADNIAAALIAAHQGAGKP